MQGTAFDEEAMFRVLEERGIRALLIGRRALAAGVCLLMPCIDDLILTKRWSLRRNDVDDIDLLEKLKLGEGGEPT